MVMVGVLHFSIWEQKCGSHIARSWEKPDDNFQPLLPTTANCQTEASNSLCKERLKRANSGLGWQFPTTTTNVFTHPMKIWKLSKNIWCPVLHHSEGGLQTVLLMTAALSERAPTKLRLHQLISSAEQDWVVSFLPPVGRGNKPQTKSLLQEITHLYKSKLQKECSKLWCHQWLTGADAVTRSSNSRCYTCQSV